MFQLPFLDKISKCKSILISGCGGGYDVFAGIPIYLALKQMNITVNLANLSFSHLSHLPESKIDHSIYEVNAETVKPQFYFPEYFLSLYFKEKHKESVTIYTFPRLGLKPIKKAYKKLTKFLKCDCIITVDGGTDSLMFGDEDGLGTPEEDSISVLSVASCKSVPIKILACVGFGIDSFHGVCHYQFLENVSTLIKEDGFLGAFSYMKEMAEVKEYIEICDYVFEKTQVSIVNASIVNSIEGKFGGDNSRMQSRVSNSTLFINPLMSLCWSFDIEKVAKHILYTKNIENTKTRLEVGNRINEFREKLQKEKKIKICEQVLKV
ncbi:hypothetical protein M0811_01543 [Anaeramoeba ignava]|uniref:DUF1152 domain-containing protein n=1 Tax=Anaeramoeba ignava TaxID=1746090 RepID=A0A9Q0LGW1_ANAIG|nr:hypothetical protein M0811_01543 [Anaeramoeba ignava]